MGNGFSLPMGVVMLCLCAPSAHADTIYQCASQDGAPVLQNVPCQPGSEVWVQKGTPLGNSAPLAPGAAQATIHGASNADATARADASAAPADAPAGDSDELSNLPSEPALGMSQRQVRAILGPPSAVTREEVVDGNLVTWTYGDSRVVQFDTS